MFITEKKYICLIFSVHNAYQNPMIKELIFIVKQHNLRVLLIVIRRLKTIFYSLFTYQEGDIIQHLYVNRIQFDFQAKLKIMAVQT